MKSQAIPGGELEVSVLRAVWDLGSPSSREIYEHVGAPRGLVYTTIAKVLDRLFDKGLVSRKRAGKGFVYRAKVERSVVESARLRDTVRSVVADQPRPAMVALVDAVESIDPKLIDELKAVVDDKRRRRGS